MMREAHKAGIKPRVSMFVTAGSGKTRATVEQEGFLQEFEEAGATFLSNSCGPCVSIPTV